jgi:hypothetical protein
VNGNKNNIDPQLNNYTVCFERTHEPPWRQLSNFPTNDEPGVKYYFGYNASISQVR